MAAGTSGTPEPFTPEISSSKQMQAEHSFSDDTPTDVNFNAIAARVVVEQDRPRVEMEERCTTQAEPRSRGILREHVHRAAGLPQDYRLQRGALGADRGKQ